MRVEIRTQHIEHPRPVRAHAEQRLGAAVRRFSDRISSAQVCISDVNGPRGGVDKRCRVQLQGRALHLVVEGAGADAYAAVDDAIDIVSRSVRRAMEKGRTRETTAHRIIEHLPT